MFFNCPASFPEETNKHFRVQPCSFALISRRWKLERNFVSIKKFALFLDIFAKSTVWYLQFCLISTNFCFSLMLVNWVSASSRNKFWTGLIPSLQVQEWRKFMFCTDLTLIQVDSYSFRNFISAPILCMSFYSNLVLFWGICGFFSSTKNSRKNNAPSKATLKEQWVWTSWKLLNQYYLSSLKLHHCRNFESHIWQCSSRAVKTQDYCYLAGVERSVCIKLAYIAMSNLSVAEEFTSTKINKYSIQLLNTMQKKKP